MNIHLLRIWARASHGLVSHVKRGAAGSLAIALLASIFSCSSLLAQSVGQSQISGTIYDTSHATIAGAKVSATQTNTQLVRSTVSGTDGAYVIPDLPIGPYRLEVAKDGFKIYVQTGIILEVASSPTVDATLAVGSTTTSVVVDAGAVMVDTESTGVGQVIEQERISDLPLNNRLPTQLIPLTGAAVVVPSAVSGQLITNKNYPNEQAISVAGGQANGLTFTLDGVTHNDPENNADLVLPFPDALQEFKVETSALPAQYGQHAGGAVNAVTKSGENSLHGDAFEFLRNGDLNAKDHFAVARDSLKRNQFGGTLGGPIKKDKVFFFGGYQGTIQKANASTGISFVPTPAMMAGDFTDITSPACNGGRQITLGAPFVNNMISPTLFSQPAVKMVSFYQVPTNPCGQVSFLLRNNFSEHAGVVKVDYLWNANHSMFGRYQAAHSYQPPSFTGSPLSIVSASPNDFMQSIAFGDNYIISPTAVNSFHYGFNRSAVNKTQVQVITSDALGINITPPPRPDNVEVAVTGALYTNGLAGFPFYLPAQSWQLADDVSLARGSHQIRFGVSWIHEKQNATATSTSDGWFDFDGQFTGLPMADFLVGQPDFFSQTAIQKDYERIPYLGLYVQDSWRATSRLRVNYGIRWEPYFGTSFPNGRVSHFNMALFEQNIHSTIFPNAPAGTQYPGDPGFRTNNRANYTRWTDFAPRIGVAWDPMGDGRTVVRASWGIFYDFPQTLFFNGYAGEPPWAPDILISSPSGGFQNPWAGFPGGNPFSDPASLEPVKPSPSAPIPPGVGYDTVPLHVHNTYVDQWNLSLQRQIGRNWLASVSYIGNNTIHLWGPRDIDPAVYMPGASCVINGQTFTPCSSAKNTDRRRALTLINPVQGAFYSTLTELNDGETGSYNALLLSLQHRFTNHFTVLANYTWSHCISDPVFNSYLFSSSGPPISASLDFKADRGNCPGTDITHGFNLSSVLESPRFSNRALQVIAGNWQLSQILTVYSGQAVNVVSGVDSALNGDGAGLERPDQRLSNPYCAHKGQHCWLNPAAFGVPAPGNFGNLVANSLRGPGLVQLDMSLARNIPIHESLALQFRVDAFNLPNLTNLSNPVSTLSSGNFGRITSDITAVGSAVGDPRIVQLSLKLSF
ncbi:MAG TPA: carboxypeptidase regulatory-like domain-containing protein [Terriglobales bacterium]|nr:carboxypeptidase regulatory-like domain-containing protein [Terriglobales bacterium]